LPARALAAVGGPDLVAAGRALDELARVAFRAPFDGYVQRMAWIAADEGRIPWEYAVDRARPAGLRDAERNEVVTTARSLRVR
jgi:4-hydroxy-tetrahydrodipicolinate synthase